MLQVSGLHLAIIFESRCVLKKGNTGHDSYSMSCAYLSKEYSCMPQDNPETSLYSWILGTSTSIEFLL